MKTLDDHTAASRLIAVIGILTRRALDDGGMDKRSAAAIYETLVDGIVSEGAGTLVQALRNALDGQYDNLDCAAEKVLADLGKPGL